MHRETDPEGWSWGNKEELLAALVESSEVGNLMYLKAHVPEGTQLPDPVHIPRPGEQAAAKQRPKRRAATEDDMKQKFGKAIKFTSEHAVQHGSADDVLTTKEP